MQPSLSKKALAARANGAKSRGPKTEQGKRRSSQNAVRHGLLSQSILLEGESPEAFEALRRAHLEKFQPADDVELNLVEQMVAANWRMRRLWSIETTLFDEAMAQHPELSPESRMAAAFTQLAENKQLQLIDRYEARFHRIYQRSLKCLLEIRENSDFSHCQTNPSPPIREARSNPPRPRRRRPRPPKSPPNHPNFPHYQTNPTRTASSTPIPTPEAPSFTSPLPCHRPIEPDPASPVPSKKPSSALCFQHPPQDWPLTSARFKLGRNCS